MAGRRGFGCGAGIFHRVKDSARRQAREGVERALREEARERVFGRSGVNGIFIGAGVGRR